MLTVNEKGVLRLLFMAFGAQYSINGIAKECNITPNGAHKILKKLKEQNIVQSKIIANIKSYYINFDDDKTESVIDLAISENLQGRMKHRYEDLILLKDITKAAVIFGSYVRSKEPRDLDILFVLEKDSFKQYKETLRKIRDISPVPIHDVIQTKEDFQQNISKNDPIIRNALQRGIILWGRKMIIKVMRNVSKKET